MFRCEAIVLIACGVQLSFAFDFETLPKWEYMKNEIVQTRPGQFKCIQEYLSDVSTFGSAMVKSTHDVLMKNRAYKYLFLMSFYSVLIVHQDDALLDQVRCMYRAIVDHVENYMDSTGKSMTQLLDVKKLLDSDWSGKLEFLSIFKDLSKTVQDRFDDWPVEGHELMSSFLINSSYENLRKHYKWQFYGTVLDSSLAHDKKFYPPQKSLKLTNLILVFDKMFNDMFIEYEL